MAEPDRHFGEEGARLTYGSYLRATELLEQFDLTDAADRAAKTYSGGMQRRLDLAASLVGQPKVLFLDEPTTGLDPRSKLDVQTFIEELRETHDASIVLTTHAMDEADHLCDRVAIMDRGHILCEDAPEALKRSLPTGEHVLFETDRPIEPLDRDSIIDAAKSVR